MDTREAWTRDPAKVAIYDKSNAEFQKDLMSAGAAIAKLNNLLNTEDIDRTSCPQGLCGLRSFSSTLTVPEKITKLVKAVRAKYPAKAAECDKVDKALDDWQGEDEWHEPTSGPPSIQLDRVIFQSARTKKYA